MTKASPQVIIAPTANPVVAKAIIRGRRSYGEDWNEVTASWDDETQDIVYDVVATEAPADNTAIIVPSNGMQEVEMIDFILGEQRKRAEYRAAHPERQPYESMQAEVSAMWNEYVEQKLKAFKRESTFGPGGHTQRGDQ